jgi:hypothetical protein
MEQESAVIRRVLVGILYFFVLYLGACIVAGAIAGGMAGSQHPNDPKGAAEAGARAGAEVVQNYRLYFLAGAFLIGFCGSLAGIMPGSRGKSQSEDVDRFDSRDSDSRRSRRSRDSDMPDANDADDRIRRSP